MICIKLPEWCDHWTTWRWSHHIDRYVNKQYCRNYHIQNSWVMWVARGARVSAAKVPAFCAWCCLCRGPGIAQSASTSVSTWHHRVLQGHGTHWRGCSANLPCQCNLQWWADSLTLGPDITDRKHTLTLYSEGKEQNEFRTYFDVFISLFYMFWATQCSSSGEMNCINAPSGTSLWKEVNRLKLQRYMLRKLGYKQY